MLSLLFRQGERPGPDALAALARADAGPQHFSISQQPDPDEGWLELLASGLTFDCRGLSPAPSAALPPHGTLLGLAAEPSGEAVALAPGPHLMEGAGLLPVVRALTGVAASLATLPGVEAVVWQPSRCWMEPGYFSRIVRTWLAGGAFPALGLTALVHEGNAGMASLGLALFTGQELRLEGMEDRAPGDLARIALRLVHELVLDGPLHEPRDYLGPAGEMLYAVPDGRLIRVSLQR